MKTPKKTTNIGFFSTFSVLLISLCGILYLFSSIDLLHSNGASNFSGLHEDCVDPPLCHSPRLSLIGRMLCLLRASPFDHQGKAYREYVRGRLQRLGPRFVKGQYSLEPILRSVAYKLAYMHEPLVLHLAGDNGVGKTRTAEVISLAVAQRCGNEDCSLGESTLVLSGTSYDGMTLSEFRRSIVPTICQHAARYPHNGVLIINDLSALEPQKVRLLLPVLGRGERFPEFPRIDLARLIVIVTTDFGKEGRTQGKSLDEMRYFINTEFQDLYTHRSTSIIQTFPYLPISLETALEIVNMTIQDLSCRYQNSLSILDEAALWIVEKAKQLLPVENGRAVVQEVMRSVGPLLEERNGTFSNSSVLGMGLNGELVFSP
ncbi:unnamed protein product [Phytomonas sp. Hart1]|nr:unnamed protein product [Phytomonas sp. Hart1]|eukprot:CCW65911.1 unnamed protein product [Phytomonas sp. isolate Hart1]